MSHANNIQKELTKAQEYYKSKKYTEAENIYSKNYKTNPDEFKKWDKIFYSWSIYRHYLCQSEDEDILNESGELIKELTKQEDLSKKDKPCVYTLSMIKLIDNFSKNKEYDNVIYWCEQLNPKLLSPKKFKSYNDNIFPSKKEKWYIEITKALLNIGEYEKCLEYSKEALDEIEEFTNDNDIWIKYRIGKSYKELGDFDDAIEILKEVYKNKAEWYIQKEIAENYYFKGDFENSLKYAVEAALNNKQIDMKVNLYSLIQELLKKKGEQEAADKHAYLIYSVKLNKEHEISEKLEETVENAGFDLDNDQYWKIEKDLRDYWVELQYKDQPLNYGTIETILPHGKSGFIMADDNQSYFFNMFDYIGDKNDVKIGDYVSFYLKKGFDKKKNKESLNAVHIKPVIGR